MKKLMYMVSALVLGLGLTASQTSFAEFLPPPMPIAPIAPIGGVPCAACSLGAFNSLNFAGASHGIYNPWGGFGYGGYRYGYGFGYGRGFLARGACGFPYRFRHRYLCGRGRRSFRAFSLSIGFGGFGFSLNSVRF